MSNKYRSKDSYISKDPVKRQKSLANLTYGHKKPEDQKNIAKGLFNAETPSETLGIIEWCEQNFILPETRKPIVFLDFQKKIINDIFYSGKDYSLAVLGMPKKSGKSTFAAAIVSYYLFNKDFQNLYLLAPDKEASQFITFEKIKKSIKLNPSLNKRCKIKQDCITNLVNDSFVRCLANNITVSGLNMDITILDETWQFTSQESKRTLDEMTNVPGKQNLILSVSYAGFENSEDSHLWRWYQQGINNTQDENFYFLWRTSYLGVIWVTEKYLENQRKRLSENAYRRFHENKWTECEEAFISHEIIMKNTKPELWKGCASLNKIFVGVDIGLKNDFSAIAVVGKSERENCLALFDHAVFKPEGQELNLEDTVERFILELSRRYKIGKILYDPFQFARSAQTLRSKGLPMQEFPQTVSNTVQASENLKSLLNAGRLDLYDNQEIREHLKNAAAKESNRGMRIIKGGSQAHKIDFTIALSMASLAATNYYLLKREAKACKNPVRFK
jgi:phage terminase large subunit-like protein